MEYRVFKLGGENIQESTILDIFAEFYDVFFQGNYDTIAYSEIDYENPNALENTPYGTVPIRNYEIDAKRLVSIKNEFYMNKQVSQEDMEYVKDTVNILKKVLAEANGSPIRMPSNGVMQILLTKLDGNWEIEFNEASNFHGHYKSYVSKMKDILKKYNVSTDKDDYSIDFQLQDEPMTNQRGYEAMLALKMQMNQ